MRLESDRFLEPDGKLFPEQRLSAVEKLNRKLTVLIIISIYLACKSLKIIGNKPIRIFDKHV